MYDNLRELLPDDLSDETAYCIVRFLHELALAFESIHLGKIMRYQRSREILSDDIVNRSYVREQQQEEESEDSPF